MSSKVDAPASVKLIFLMSAMLMLIVPFHAILVPEQVLFLLEFLAVILLFLVFWPGLYLQGTYSVVIWFLCLCVMLATAYVIPLSLLDEIVLPGRELYDDVGKWLEQQGVDQGSRYLSIIPYSSSLTLLALLPPVAIFLAIILIPSGIKFKQIFDKSVFENSAKSFVKEEVSQIDGVKIFDEDYNFDTKTITLFLAGNSLVTERRQKELQKKLSNEKYHMDNCSLVIIQNDEFQNSLTMDDFRLMSKDWENKIMERDKKIKQLENAYETKTDFTYDLKSANKKMKLVSEFDALEGFSASKAYKVNVNGEMVTTLLIVVDWLDSNLIPKRTDKLNKWIEVNFETTNYQVIEKIKQ